MLDRLFSSRRALNAIRLRRRARSVLARPLELEEMEERRLLAIAAFQYPTNDVDTAPNNYVVLVLD